MRPSFQRIAGRITSSRSSNVTRPCICPPKLIPATRLLSHSARSSFKPSIDCSYQSAGFCSDQPGCGNERSYVRDAIFFILPSTSISSNFTADVPRSIPIYNILSPFLIIARLRYALQDFSMQTDSPSDSARLPADCSRSPPPAHRYT